MGDSKSLAPASKETQELNSSPNKKATKGDTKVKVNPAINAASVYIPTHEDDDGLMQGDTYLAGKLYDADPKLLEVEDGSGNPLFVEVKEGE